LAIVTYSVINDVHIPYQAKAYYDAIKLMKTWPNLKHIYLNGDIAEIESVSTHPKTEGAKRLLLDELDCLNSELDALAKTFPDANVTFVEGNHCSRVFRYIRDVAPEMWGLVHLPTLLKFDKRDGWLFVPYGPSQWVKCGKTHDLWIRHEPLGGGMGHAKVTAERSYVSVLYGHTHQYQQHTIKKIGPKPYHVTATSGGWLGDIKQPCFDYRGCKDNWQLGFTRIDCDESTGEYELRFIRLEK
jgi:predicted phosphodiesterase